MADGIKKYLDLEGLGLYDEKIKKVITDGDAATLQSAKDYADGLADDYDAAGSAATAEANAKAHADSLTSSKAEKTYVDDTFATKAELTQHATDAEAAYLKKTDAESTYITPAGVDQKIGGATELLKRGEIKANTDAIDAINEKIGNTNNLVTIDKEIVGAINTAFGTLNAVQGIANENSQNIDAVETDLGDVDTLSTTKKTVVGAINEVLAAVGTGGTAAVVTVEKSTDGLQYTIKQGSATVGTIDIPKDMVVESGSVVVDPEGQAEGTYIKLVLANVAEPLYINVGTLVDIYVAEANAAQVQVAIDSSTREISATIVAGSVTATELAANAVVTEKIADANVTKAKLASDVQASLDKADAAASKTELANEVSNLSSYINSSGSNIVAAANEYTNTEIAKFTPVTTEEVNALFA